MIFLLSCSSEPQVIKTPIEYVDVFDSYLKPLESLQLFIEEDNSKTQTCQRGEIILQPSDLGKDCFEIQSSGKCAIIKGDKLGLQYGLSTVLF